MTPMEAEPADVALPEQCPLACGGGGAEQQQLKEQQQSQRQSSSRIIRSAAQSSSFDNSNINRSSGSNSHEHALSAVHRHNNTSKVECLALKMETRRAQRINVTWDVRNRFLRDCRKIAPTRIPLQALLDYRERVQQQVQAQKVTLLSATLEWLGFRNTAKVLLQLLDRAVIRVQDEVRDDWFYYEDFSYYFTKIESQWPFLRNAFYVSLAMLAAFYIGTAVLFCSIMNDPGVCPRDINGKWYSGWLTAIYFASSTMSTVGYGDVSVMIGYKGGGDEPPAEKWRIFVGALYMIVSLLVIILAFSNVVNQARSSSLAEACSIDKMPLLSKLSHYIYGGPPDDIKPGELLQDKVRRVRYAKFGAISTQFFVLNLLGMFANRFFILYTADNEEERWTWMETFYWSIQTTTTIGYGDMVMPFEMRWFQVFYLLISTYFVGDALGKVGSYNEEIRQLRRFFAWNRREVSLGMIADWQANDEHCGDDDDKIDQYEFAIASLLDLGIITHRDLHPIMKKFRGLAGPKGYISMEDDFDEDGGTRREASSVHYPGDHSSKSEETMNI